METPETKQTNTVPKSVRRLVIIGTIFLIAALALSGFNAYVTFAAPLQTGGSGPTTVGFSGQLADSQGSPVADGDYDLTFRLYDVEYGGTAYWTETHNDVPVADGLYSVQLGFYNSLDPQDFDDSTWLGVQVGTDSEMTPRIKVSSVPWALNAHQAMGLQGNPVNSATPQAGDVLSWDNTNGQWIPDPITFPQLASVSSGATPQDFFANFRNGAILRYYDASTVEVSPGEVMIDGYMRQNTDAVLINFAGTGDSRNLGLDTGSGQPNTTYYVYAVADDAESVFDLIISANDTTPTGPTHYRKLGWFETNASASPVEIKEGSFRNDFVRAQLRFASGSYVGNYVDDRVIETGFAPLYVRIVYYRAYENHVSLTERMADMQGDFSCRSTNWDGYGCGSNCIQKLLNDGFEIGSCQHVNKNSFTFYWIAWGY